MKGMLSKWIVIGVIGLMSANSVSAQELVSSLSEYPSLIALVSQAGSAVSAYDTLVEAGVTMNNTLGGINRYVSPVLGAAGRIAGENYSLTSKMPTSVKGLMLANMSPQEASDAMTGLLILDKTMTYTDDALAKIRENRVEAINDTAITSMAYALGNEAAIKKEQETDGLVAQALGNATDMQALFRTLTAVDRQTLVVSLQNSAIESTSASVKAMRALDGVEQSAATAAEEAAEGESLLDNVASGLGAADDAAAAGLGLLSDTMKGVSSGVGNAVKGTQNAVSSGSKAATEWVVDAFKSSGDDGLAEADKGGAS